MTTDLNVLLATAATIGVVHTLLGPDHYVPFIALARARGWSLGRALRWTLLCGIGHVLGSVGLGVLGVALGVGVARIEWIESTRGELAAWALVTVGTLYTAWGLHRALRRRAHRHCRAPGITSVSAGAPNDLTTANDGIYPHANGEAPTRRRGTGWMLVIIFVLGPCEALIPVLMYPAATSGVLEVALVTAVFGIATILTMSIAVVCGLAGVELVALGRFERYGHAVAGAAILLCGLGILLGL
jgi:hypothetical protein